jgi:hypothetical protein
MVMIMRIWHGWTRREDADTYDAARKTEVVSKAPNDLQPGP